MNESNDNNSVSSSILSFSKPNYYPTNFKNPLLKRFTTSSHFIYDIFEPNIYFKQVKDKNRIKLTSKELSFWELLVYKMKNKKEANEGDEFITINKELANDINNFFKRPKLNGLLESFLINELSDQINRVNCTCRKLAKKFHLLSNQKVSKSTVHNKLRKILGLRWLKTTIKTKKIKNKRNMIIMIAFIKILIKCLILKFNIIFCDESCIQTINNHLKIWRKEDENLIVDIAPKRKFNLLMAVYEKGVLHFKINKDNTNENNFLEYMQDLIKTIKEKKLFPYVIVLDNLNVHKSKQLYQFYIENKVNIAFNAP